MLESYLRAARDDRWRELLAEALDASRRVASTAARLAGAPDPEGVAATLCALAFGYAAQEAAVPGSTNTEELHTALRALLIGSLFDAGDEDAARKIRDV